MPFVPYLNVEEIESAMEVTATANPGLCELITLPNLTYEGRTCHAVRIAGGLATNRFGVLFVGGVHAREWGSSDILIAFMENIINTYKNGTGLSFQGKSFTASEIQQIVETLDIFIFPDVNPDGKAFCQSGTDWRKNRRPLNGDIGVDINRNYDFLWDANLYFDPSLYFGYLYSTSSGNYHGPSPFSEAETQNIKWLLDIHPNISYFIDIHSYGQMLMYVWGDDENQSITTEKNFSNSVYNGLRGLMGDTYGEFIFDFDYMKAVYIANRMRDALFTVRGKSYTVGQIFNQVGVSAGDSAPYVFSRHFIDSTRRKIFAYGIEWGQSFQPLPAEMTNIIDDIGAAITEFCLCASSSDLFIRDNLTDTGKEPSTGILSMSPDIITRKNLIADPMVAFGDITVDPGSDRVEIGNDNYLYVRVHNLGRHQTDATVRLYFAPLTTSCSPTLWEFIDEVDVLNIPGGGFKVSDAVVWPHVPNPGTANHFCLIAVCGNSIDTFPDTTMIDSAADFIKFMQSSNNIAYRNVTFENILPDGWAEIPFVMQGFSGKETGYNLIFDGSKLPEGSRVDIKIWRQLLKGKDTKLQNIKKLSRKETLRETVLRISKENIGAIQNLKLSSKTTPKFILRIHLSEKGKHKKEYPIKVIQKLGQEEIGQITIFLRCLHLDKVPYLASKKDHFLHRSKCQQVRNLRPGYFIPYDHPESARIDGYNCAPDCLKRR